jgi:hypothetical protein
VRKDMPNKFIIPLNEKVKKKGKSIPVTGPEGP